MKPYKWITEKFEAHSDLTSTAPITIPCETKKHSPPYADTELYLVTLICQRYGFDGTTIVRVFAGACPDCGNRYAYSPDATPAQLEMIKQKMEKPR